MFDEIHGVASPVEESALFVKTNLNALKEEIDKIKHKPAYDQAMILEPEYTQDPAFCIQFLRAKKFNAKAAATQLVAYLEIKKELFGLHRLCKDIEFSDLDENDKDLLRSGMYPFLKARDNAGRAIFLFINELLNLNSFESWARMFFYMCMSHLKDEEVQRRGFVVIIWMHGSSPSLTNSDFLLWGKGSAIADMLPIRISGGMHYCAAGTRLRPGLELAMTLVGRHLRIRFRVHFGYPMECLYNLGSYGIPLGGLPIDLDGKVNLREHHSWYQLLVTARESSCKKTGLSAENVVPCPADILMGGKSKEFMYHPGNFALRKMVKDALPKYNSLLSRADKTSIALEIVLRIKADGGRFLNREDDFTWREVGNETAREKVAHAFRNQRRHVKSKTPSYF